MKPTLTLAVFSATALAASKLNPSYEIHFLLDPSVVLAPSTDASSSFSLDTYSLIPPLLSAFSMSTTTLQMSIQYLDTPSQTLYNAGWSPRIRKLETSSPSTYELTYKKRYPIASGINAALETAKSEGFTSSSPFDGQVEWGWANQTLSVSDKKDVKIKGYSGLEMPDAEDSKRVLRDEAPGLFGLVDELDEARVYGPVRARRSVGEWEGEEVDVEVWEVRTEDGEGLEGLVEVSFKTKGYTDAVSRRDALVHFLAKRGWLVERDSLKTGLIMGRY
ncbi:hypothetical protein OQA88_6039 [Cercophora sp. LCS_1]